MCTADVQLRCLPTASLRPCSVTPCPHRHGRDLHYPDHDEKHHNPTGAGRLSFASSCPTRPPGKPAETCTDGLNGVRGLSLMSSMNLSSLTGAENLPALVDLDVDGCSALTDATALLRAPALASIDLSRTGIEVLDLSFAHVLEYVRVIGCQNLRQLKGPVNARVLVLGLTPKLKDLSPLADSTELRRLNYWGTGISATHRLILPPGLESLDVSLSTREITITGGGNLTELSVPYGDPLDAWREFISERPITNLTAGLENSDGANSALSDVASLATMREMRFVAANSDAAHSAPELDGYVKNARHRIVTYQRRRAVPAT
jgi:hypothetical protein